MTQFVLGEEYRERIGLFKQSLRMVSPFVALFCVAYRALCPGKPGKQLCFCQTAIGSFVKAMIGTGL
jgi:hypothetical protein